MGTILHWYFYYGWTSFIGWDYILEFHHVEIHRIWLYPDNWQRNPCVNLCAWLEACRMIIARIKSLHSSFFFGCLNMIEKASWPLALPIASSNDSRNTISKCLMQPLVVRHSSFFNQFCSDIRLFVFLRKTSSDFRGPFWISLDIFFKSIYLVVIYILLEFFL